MARLQEELVVEEAPHPNANGNVTQHAFTLTYSNFLLNNCQFPDG
jgi:hypothetical protein